MIWLAYLGVAVGVVGYTVGLLLMDETASDIGNGAMLTTAVILLFRIKARLERSGDSGESGGSGDAGSEAR